MQEHSLSDVEPAVSACRATPAEPSKPRWSVVTALCVAALRPRETARRTAHLLLSSVWKAHLLTILFGLHAVLAVSSASRNPTIPWRDAILLDVGVTLHRFEPPLWVGIVIAIGIFLFVCAGFLLVAFLVMPWGAQDEPVSASRRNALRCTWLQSLSWFTLLVVVFAAERPLSLEENRLWGVLKQPMHAYPSAPDTPRVANAPEWIEYQQKVAAWRAHWNLNRAAVRKAMPWYVRDHEEKLLGAFFLGSLWLLAGLLRMVGARPPAPARERTPVCRRCGYNLTGLAPDAQCPECGTALTVAMGPESYAGPLWRTQRHEARKLIARFRLFLAQTREAFCAPAQLGEQLPLAPTDHVHRSFLAIPLAAVGILGFLALPILTFAKDRSMSLWFGNDDALWYMVLSGTGLAAGMFVLLLATSLVMAAWYGWGTGHNLMPVAMQAAVYSSGSLAGMMYLLFAATVVIILCHGWFGSLAHWITQSQWPPGLADREKLMVLTWMAIAGVLIGVWGRRVGRVVRAARYANR